MRAPVPEGSTFTGTRGSVLEKKTKKPLSSRPSALGLGPQGTCYLEMGPPQMMVRTLQGAWVPSMRAVGDFLSYGVGQIDPLTCESQVILFCLPEQPDRGKALLTLTVMVAASKLSQDFNSLIAHFLKGAQRLEGSCKDR